MIISNHYFGAPFYLAMCLALSMGFLTDNAETLEERLAAIERNLTTLLQLQTNVAKLQNEISVLQGCSADFCGIHWSTWSEWSAWSACTGQCNQGYGSREQTRTRTRKCINENQPVSLASCSGDSSQSDKRPCNAVELYGCLNGQNTNNTGNLYGVTYNFFDELAQSTCVSAIHTPKHVAAVRRDCYSGKAVECSQICSNLGYSCFDALHIYHPSKTLKPNIDHQTDEGVVGLYMYRYFSCTWGNGGCGPNYCCCQWP